MDGLEGIAKWLVAPVAKVERGGGSGPSYVPEHLLDCNGVFFQQLRRFCFPFYFYVCFPPFFHFFRVGSQLWPFAEQVTCEGKP